jgi:hypothetical protein
MKRLRAKKMTLNRETLRSLQADELRRAGGGDSFQYGCDSGSCPNDCGNGTSTCPSNYPCDTVDAPCSVSCFQPC